MKKCKPTRKAPVTRVSLEAKIAALKQQVEVAKRLCNERIAKARVVRDARITGLNAKIAALREKAKGAK